MIYKYRQTQIVKSSSALFSAMILAAGTHYLPPFESRPLAFELT
jgi:hypothetical protein